MYSTTAKKGSNILKKTTKKKQARVVCPNGLLVIMQNTSVNN